MSDDIGARIKTARIRRGLSLSELARRANISRGYLHNIEHGVNQNPGAKRLASIAECLEISTETLVFGSEIPSDLPEVEVQLLLLWRRGQWADLLRLIAREMPEGAAK